MRINRFRSKGLVHFLIFAFLLLIMAETVPAGAPGASEEEKGPVVRVRANGLVSAAQQEEFETLMAEGKKLYNDMENEQALRKFHQARAVAVTQKQKSDVYFYLSLVFYGLLEDGRSNEFTNAVNMLIEVDYYKHLDPQLCPQRYIEMHQEIKKNYGVLKVRSAPAGADVYLNDEARPSGMTPLTIAALAGEVSLEVKKGKKKAKSTIEVVAGEETQSPEYELKGGSSTIYIIGGVLLAAGVGAAVALGGGSGSDPGGSPPQNTPTTTGSLQVNSTPAGAQIYLDGNNTNQTTNATISNVSQGDHTLMLVREGYVEHEQVVSVSANQTATVNAGLNKHVLTIKSPTKNSEWNTGDVMDIIWELQASSQGLLPVTALGNHTPLPHPAGLNRTSSSSAARTNSSVRSARSPLNRGSRTTGQSLQVRSLQGAGMRSSARRTPYPGAMGSNLNRTAMLGQGTLEGPLFDTGIQSLSTVKIDLYKGDSFHLNIAQSTENDGHHEWAVPKSLKAGDNFKIKISSDKSEEVSFQTPKFKIVDLPFSLVVDKTEVTVKEGKTASFNVKLSAKPNANVNVTVKRASGDEDITVQSGASLTFTKSNWGTNQKVVLAAGIDFDRWHGEAIIRVSTADAPNKDVHAIENDKDYVEGPVLGIAPIEDFSSAGIVGGPFTPAEKLYKITNYGNSPLEWKIEESANWLDVSHQEGALAPRENVKVALVINSNANGLSVGAYSQTVKFVNLINNVGTTEIEATLDVATEPPPDPPSNLNANSVRKETIYRIDLDWTDNSNDETGFEVWRASIPKGIIVKPLYIRIAILAANVTSYGDTGASSEGIYNYRVRAVKGDVVSSFSATATEVNLDMPSGLSVAYNPLTRSATLSWNDNSSIEDKYYIYGRTSPIAKWIKGGEASANATSWSLLYRVPPLPGTYYFTVRTVCIHNSVTYYSDYPTGVFFKIT